MYNITNIDSVFNFKNLFLSILYIVVLILMSSTILWFMAKYLYKNIIKSDNIESEYIDI